MKKMLVLMLVAGMAVLASCGNKTAEDTLVEPEQTEQVPLPEETSAEVDSAEVEVQPTELDSID
ncbi:hypothetical protein CLW00_104282 [Mongoliibacter ruber]|uniref:Uncharacterized protein n=2 Tax=Mongoliibacter ruber TaxID=1750599 RepID=A0A2T0WPJ4_9BACT|nr:hypothetical protein CLW00_104282 [Mongoliibacter ruber]